MEKISSSDDELQKSDIPSTKGKSSFTLDNFEIIEPLEALLQEADANDPFDEMPELDVAMVDEKVENAQRLVEKLLISDDSDGLIIHLRFGDVKLPHQYILDRALTREAYNCVDVLLRLKLDLNNILPFYGATPLQIAAEKMNPRLVEAFLRHGAKPDDGWSPDFKSMLYCSIPLEVACGELCAKLDNQWNADQPIFKLIILLCLPQTRDSLETIRLLVQVSKDANKVLCLSAQRGSLIELAIFLMVIREKVLGDCIPFLREIGFGLNGNMRKRLKRSTILQVVAVNKILDGFLHEFSYTQVLMMYERLKLSADSLLQVFEKAGCAIEKYLKLQDPDVSEERVIGDVTLLLLEAGFSVKPEDVNLSDLNRCAIGGTIKLSDKKSDHSCFLSSLFAVVIFSGQWSVLYAR